MWCVIMTETGIQGEAYRPAIIGVETYDTAQMAESAMRRMFASRVKELTDLEYCEFNLSGHEARLFGELSVTVIAARKLPDPAGKEHP